MAKKDRLDLGAVLQRDKESYAIVPHIPGGICTPDTLRKIAEVAEKFNAKAIKATGAQRLAIVGLKEEDLEKVWQELGMNPAAAVGMCVRSIKFCPGTTFCRLAQQDSIKMGLKLDEMYHGYKLPAKFKIGVSGCPNACADSWIRDIGLIGTKKGWKLVGGGNGGRDPRIAHVLAENLNDEQALELIQKIIQKFENVKKPSRIGKYINEIGIEEFKREIGISDTTSGEGQVDLTNINEEALYNLTYGLYVVGSVKDGKVNAQIANTVIQVTSEPPKISVTLHKNNLTHEYIKDSGVFSVSILSQDTPPHFIGTFGFKSGKDVDKFSNVKYVVGKTGAPIIVENALAVMEAKVVGSLDIGTHTIFVGEVVASDVVKKGTPLTYEYYHKIKKGKEPKNAPTYREEPKTDSAKTGEEYVCKVCGYIYDPTNGDPDNNIEPGTPFEKLPDNWTCPVCGASKSDFEKI